MDTVTSTATPWNQAKHAWLAPRFLDESQILRLQLMGPLFTNLLTGEEQEQAQSGKRPEGGCRVPLRIAFASTGSFGGRDHLTPTETPPLMPAFLCWRADEGLVLSGVAPRAHEKTALSADTPHQDLAEFAQSMPLSLERSMGHNGSAGVFRNVAAKERFIKTKPCRFFAIGQCRRGEECAFAHGLDLRSSPDLWKSSLCFRFSRGRCGLAAEDCRFAHGSEDLQHVRTFHKVRGRQGREHSEHREF